MTIQSIEICSRSVNRLQTASLKSKLEALLAPLHQLDQRLQQTIEVRQILSGTAFEHFLLGGVVPIQAPAAAIVSGSLLANFKQSFDLSDFDIEVVLMAIAPELDRRYERLYANLQSGSSRRPTVGLALNLLSGSVAEKEQSCDRFHPDSPLIRSGVLQLKKRQCGATPVSADDTFALSPAVSRYLLGQPMCQQLATYCQVSWPQSTPQVTNSPLLSSLIDRLRAGDVSAPLALNFTGAGAKLSGAEILAATLQKPLLTVDLQRLFESRSLSEINIETEIDYIAHQIMLQGRLWDAVVLIQHEEAKATENSWLPATFMRSLRSQSEMHDKQSIAVQCLCRQLAAYSGIVIFTGQPSVAPNEHPFQSMTNIPFSPFPSDNVAERWSDCWNAATMLGDTELFRQQLIDASAFS